MITVTDIQRCFDRLIRRKASPTKRAYRGDVADYHAWAGGENWADAVRELVRHGPDKARERLTDYQAARTKAHAKATIRRRIAALQAIVAELRATKKLDWQLRVDSDTSSSKETKKATAPRDMSGPSPAEMRKLRAYLATDRTLAGFRDRAMIALMENPMLREHELVALDVSDIDLDRQRVRIIGKARDEPEWLRMPSPTRAEVSGWLELAQVKRGTPLFRQIIRYKRKRMKSSWHEIAGQWLTDDRLSTTAVYEMTLARGRAAGLKRRLRPHGLRHTGITLLVADCLKNKIPLAKAQQITRHRKIETLLKYVDPQDEDTAEILERTSRQTR